MLEIPYEDGLVTVLSTFRPFSNHAIGRYDHAELLWRLASNQRPGGSVAGRTSTQSLAMADQKRPAALIAFGLFLALALWCVIPRFGPLMPNPAPNRRSLVEHLSGTGRFYWTQRQLPGSSRLCARTASSVERAPPKPWTGRRDAARAAARLTGRARIGITHPPQRHTNSHSQAAFRQQPRRTERGERASGHSPAGREGTDRRRDHKTRAEFDRAFSQMKDGKVQP
jgi:hypothetical protein